MILIDLKTRKEYFVPLKKTSGEELHVCPECSENRKKKTIKCFSFNHDKSVGHCAHCQITLLIKKEFEVKKEYTRPEKWKNKTALSEKFVKFFEDKRGISQNTLNHFKVTNSIEYMPQLEAKVNVIEFNYFRNDDLINIKYRGPKKAFKLFKDAELILYNLDSIKDSEEVVICEGEIDAMSIHQSGFKHVVSVPNGAGLHKVNLDFIDNCIEYFENKKKIYLATDNDLAGRNLQEQLAERLGKERCFKIQFKDCKDANECLIKYGIQGIIESFADKKEFPLEGIFTIEDYSYEINDLYDNGFAKGAKTNMPNLNKLITFHKGYITTITGIPNMGKSDALDQITLGLSLTSDWKGGWYSPENKPTSLHISKLARKLIGKDWWGENRMSKEDIELAKNYLNDRFFFIKPHTDFTLDTILNHVKQLILRKGIDYFVIDAWNKLEHKYNGDEHKYIGECLDRLAVFCETNNVHLFLVAHPRKMQKQFKSSKYEIPNLYDISGSANFFNKSDNGICIHRDYEEDTSYWYVQKVKFSHWGSTGYCENKYDLQCGRFNEYHGSGESYFDKTPWIHSVKKEPSIEIKQQAAVHGIILDDGSGHSF